MPLAELVTIDVGAAIAKSIFKLWIKDSQLGEDISSSLIDLLKARTSDALAQRRGQRQFDIIGEKIGDSLLRLFESEGARLNENDRIAVAREVAAAFTGSKLSSVLLAKYDLEPRKLAEHILASNVTATMLFSSDEEAFYRRVIEESCIYIVDIASQLPAFTEHTFAEVLKRENQMIARANEILQEISRVREQLNPLIGAERFEIDFRLSVARTLDELHLVGADVSLPARRHRLSVAYINLSVEQRLGKASVEGAVLTHHPQGSDFESAQSVVGTNVISVNRALASSHRLLISGPAGSGKTTLLQWIAVKSATRTFEGILEEWNKTIPFYIRLRQNAQSELPRPEVFPGLVAPAIADTMPKGWVHSALASGRAIVLIDGLDEVSASRREEVWMWLEGLVKQYSLARFIVTSRLHAVEDGWVQKQNFSDAELQPMQLTDIFSFIEHWHNAVRDELQNDEEKSELNLFAEHLKHEVRRNRAIRNLATSPLLCAMLCALNHDRWQQIPKDRIELYEACCLLLLERRDLARKVDLSDYPALQLPYRQKCRFLEDLAYWMIKNDWSEVSDQFVDERFSNKLAGMGSIPPEVTGSAIRQLFVERSGIIRVWWPTMSRYSHEKREVECPGPDPKRA